MNAWKDCPECGGKGTITHYDPDAVCPHCENGADHGNAEHDDGFREYPCPTCLAHFKAVEEAVTTNARLTDRIKRLLQTQVDMIAEARWLGKLCSVCGGSATMTKWITTAEGKSIPIKAECSACKDLREGIERVVRSTHDESAVEEMLATGVERQ